MKYFEHDGDLGPLFEALAEAQSKMAAVVKGAKGEADKGKEYNYADLASVQDACLPHLNKEGLAIMQIPMRDDTSSGCATILGHKSGAWIAGATGIGDDPWADGSAFSYARRYALAAFAQIPQKDDDGATAKKAAPKKAAKGRVPATRKQDKPKPPEAIVEEAVALAKDVFPGATEVPAESPSPSQPAPGAPGDFPKNAEDVVASKGAHKGVALPLWPTEYVEEVAAMLLAKKDDLPKVQLTTLVLIRAELGRRGIDPDATKTKETT